MDEGPDALRAKVSDCYFTALEVVKECDGNMYDQWIADGYKEVAQLLKQVDMILEDLRED